MNHKSNMIIIRSHIFCVILGPCWAIYHKLLEKMSLIITYLKDKIKSKYTFLFIYKKHAIINMLIIKLFHYYITCISNYTDKVYIL